MAKRVHQLAKELGVKSTAIVAKCQAEGLEVKNHMSTLSAGLEATIREWFSESCEHMTVETAAPVDLAKVKMKRKPRQKKPDAVAEVEVAPEAAEAEAETAAVPVAEAAPAASEADTGVSEAAAEVAASATAEPPAAAGTEKQQGSERPKRISPKEREEAEREQAAEVPREPMVGAEACPEPSSAVPAEAEADAAPAVEEPAVAAAAAAAEPAVAADDTETEAPAEASSEKAASPPAPQAPVLPVEESPPPPKKPVMHVPKPAVLQGPKVIRVERADIVPAPPTRERRRPAEPAAQDPVPLPPVSGGGAGRRRERRYGGQEDREGPRRGAGGKPPARGRRRGRGTGPATGAPRQWGDRDLIEREQRLAAASGTKLAGRSRRLAREDDATGQAPHQAHRVDKATVKEPITVKDLSAVIGIRANEIIGKLMGMGVMANINQSLDKEAATMVALEFGVDLTVEEKVLLLDQLRMQFDDASVEEERLHPRPPVVAFLGHVDHGKTSLLDRIRKTTVASGEAGGITQHIGSYLYDDGTRRVAFLDTPGHQAFTAMRARGANMTDMVVLVVAADDGVMPQTEEAISHAKAAGVPIVVAVNKVDIPGVDINRVLGQLSEKDLVPAEWGGDTEVVQTSAATGAGIDDLIEHLDYVAELRHLKAQNEGNATGWIVESEMTVNKGASARILVKSGMLKPGDVVVSGCAHGRVRTLTDAVSQPLQEAGPATPAEITGLDEVPVAGDRFFVVDDISYAAQVADEQRSTQREKTLSQRRQVTLENLFSEIEAGQLRELNVIVKADVQGSLDALLKSITEMNTAEVAVRTLHAAVGGISESDILLAEASNAIVIGFQVVADEHARQMADRKGVQVRLYRVIYNVVDDIKQALEGMLTPSIEEKHLGRAAVRRVFKVSRLGSIAGCYVTDGVIPRSAKIRLIRDSVVLRDNAAIDSMKRVKDDVSEARSGFECGIKLAGFDDIKEGDILEAYETVEVSRTLESRQEQPV